MPTWIFFSQNDVGRRIFGTIRPIFSVRDLERTDVAPSRCRTSEIKRRLVAVNVLAHSCRSSTKEKGRPLHTVGPSR